MSCTLVFDNFHEATTDSQQRAAFAQGLEEVPPEGISIIVLSLINIVGVRTGAMVQNVFTFAKAAALFGLVMLGLTIGRNAQATVTTGISDTALATVFAPLWHALQPLDLNS